MSSNCTSAINVVHYIFWWYMLLHVSASFGHIQRELNHKKVNYMYYIESFIYPTDAHLDRSKNVNIYIKIYTRGVPTCFGFSQPSSGSYCMCFAKVININNQLKYVLRHLLGITKQDKEKKPMC